MFLCFIVPFPVPWPAFCHLQYRKMRADLVPFLNVTNVRCQKECASVHWGSERQGYKVTYQASRGQLSCTQVCYAHVRRDTRPFSIYALQVIKSWVGTWERDQVGWGLGTGLGGLGLRTRLVGWGPGDEAILLCMQYITIHLPLLLSPHTHTHTLTTHVRVVPDAEHSLVGHHISLILDGRTFYLSLLLVSQQTQLASSTNSNLNHFSVRLQYSKYH